MISKLQVHFQHRGNTSRVAVVDSYAEIHETLDLIKTCWYASEAPEMIIEFEPSTGVFVIVPDYENAPDQ